MVRTLRAWRALNATSHHREVRPVTLALKSDAPIQNDADGTTDRLGRAGP